MSKKYKNRTMKKTFAFIILFLIIVSSPFIYKFIDAEGFEDNVQSPLKNLFSQKNTSAINTTNNLSSEDLEKYISSLQLSQAEIDSLKSEIKKNNEEILDLKSEKKDNSTTLIFVLIGMILLIVIVIMLLKSQMNFLSGEYSKEKVKEVVLAYLKKHNFDVVREPVIKAFHLSESKSKVYFVECCNQPYNDLEVDNSRPFDGYCWTVAVLSTDLNAWQDFNRMNLDSAVKTYNNNKSKGLSLKHPKGYDAFTDKIEQIRSDNQLKEALGDIQ